MEVGIKQHKGSVHWHLAHSYVMYFILLMTGITLDLVFKFKIFNNYIMVPVGAILLLFATFLILWAEHTSRNWKGENVDVEAFCRGPYCYTRSPTHWGLFLLMLGFGIVLNAFFIILSTIISFIIAKFVFQKKEEKALSEKYGAPYLEYKKIVKF